MPFLLRLTPNTNCDPLCPPGFFQLIFDSQEERLFNREYCPEICSRCAEDEALLIKPRSPQLNGQVERSHRTDQEELYQLPAYTGDVALNWNLEVWE